MDLDTEREREREEMQASNGVVVPRVGMERE